MGKHDGRVTTFAPAGHSVSNNCFPPIQFRTCEFRLSPLRRTEEEKELIYSGHISITDACTHVSEGGREYVDVKE
jgi:hypothetical protein